MHSFAQSRPGGGPDGQEEDSLLVTHLLEELNNSIKKCDSSFVKFRNIIDVYESYHFSKTFEILPKINELNKRIERGCAEKEKKELENKITVLNKKIPKAFSCLLNENAKLALNSLITLKISSFHGGAEFTLSGELQKHYDFHQVQETGNIVLFLHELNEVLQNEESN